VAPTADLLVPQVLAGDPRALARAISLVEDETPLGAELVARLHANAGRAYLVGVTGSPGAGKSTLVDRLTGELRRAGQTVGILAVDPTSPFTGGAILGDRVRMVGHSGDAGVFIRSMATRGHLGGVARATADAALVLDAGGRDVVIIETVGVGQDEVEIARTADVTVVVLVPGAGDDVQALKAGIMEIADIFVVNKADREGADQVVQAVTATLSLQSFADGAWRPPVLKTDALSGSGVAELWSAIDRFRGTSADRRHRRRRERDAARLRMVLSQRLLTQAESALAPGELERILDRIAARTLDPYSAADEILMRTPAPHPTGRAPEPGAR
jgi:LAO/AO transport system kinase